MTRRFRRTIVASLVAGALAMPVVGGWGPAARAAIAVGPATARLRGSASPPRPEGARARGALAAGKMVNIEVALKVPDPAALTAFVAALSDRRSPLFHHFLRPGQFASRFGPSGGEIATVEAWLRAEGLRPGKVSANRLSIALTAPASAVEAAFHIKLIRYEVAGGASAFTNSSAPLLPPMVVPYVEGVLGLSTLYQPHSLVDSDRTRVRDRHPQATTGGQPGGGPQACEAAANVAQTWGMLTANELASHYAMTPLYGLGDLGSGVRVALVELEPVSASDIATYQKCYHTATSINYVNVDGGPGTGAGSGESALDIEDLIGLAPRVTVDVYQAPVLDFFDDYDTIVNDDTDPVVSTSWGLCQPDSDQSTLDAEGDLFAQAASQGQTVFASAGDYGSTDCFDYSGFDQGAVSVDDPASQPYVVGVGGTSVGPNTETVWNDSSIGDGAGGGGVSTGCMPAYQDQPSLEGLISANSKADRQCGPSGYRREVPDVSADANPSTGYVIYYTGVSQGLFHGWGPIGGTSAASPLWAAVAALIDASPFCTDYASGDAGVLPQGLYRIAPGSYGRGFHDVISGNNDYTPSGYEGGLYPSATGYDMASGIGVPLVTSPDRAGPSALFYPGLAALMCWAYGTKLQTTDITGLSKPAGPATRATTVTVTGSGFLPIAGSDELAVGSKLVVASCSSTTRCEVTLPRAHAGTVDLRMHVEDLALSPAVAADRYTFVAAPTITSLSPRLGPGGGGNRVTVRGGAFGGAAGATVVDFGTKRATGLRVASDRQLSVIAPDGTGVVRVTVTSTNGGGSDRTSEDRYRYKG